ncbi:MAG TPA: penicillin-binding protein 2 [Candidatus Limnocylindria bacterium]|nr:penicillin-binding protein 2 [Candidatus Limnocylindria bacterium]
MLGRTDSRLRLVALLCGLAVFAGALGLRLAYWQVGQADELQRQASAQLSVPESEQIQRGDITDSRGTPLATTAYRDLLAAHPDLLDGASQADMARRLADVLDFTPEQEAELIGRFESDVPYLVVSRALTEEQSRQVREGVEAGELAALSLEPRPVRFYPNAGGSPGTTLASQLLGFVTADGQGQYGIEQRHQPFLAGQAGSVAATDEAVLPASEGGSLALTIDASLQLRVEKELYAAWVANRAERVSAVVLDPYSGAVLAWASVPGYDANSYGQAAQRNPELFADPIASQIYEPGSVMKMFTAAAALEQGVVTRRTIVRDSTVLRFGQSIEIRNADRRSMGEMRFEDVIAQSRNVATGRVAATLGEDTDASALILHEMWQRVGMGRPTGIELAGEAGGLVADPQARRWQPVDLVNRAFGQGVAVTTLQLAAAFGAMVNGGRLIEPHLLAAANGQPLPRSEGHEVFSATLSAELRELMVHTVTSVPHYAETTLIPGYVVGGKTGTAQIWDSQQSRWMDPIYNHTFAGFVGGERPEAVIVVRIHEAEPTVKKRFGYVLEMTSNEVFRRVAQDVIEALDIAPLDGPALDLPIQPDYELPADADEEEEAEASLGRRP